MVVKVVVCCSNLIRIVVESAGSYFLSLESNSTVSEDLSFSGVNESAGLLRLWSCHSTDSKDEFVSEIESSSIGNIGWVGDGGVQVAL